MLAELIADLLVLIHLAFILFVVLGGLLVLRWPRLAFVHLPAALWGALIEFGNWVCPLTPLEQKLRQSVGEGVYSGSFVEQYVLPLIYPSGLTREMQLALGLLVLLVNFLIYAFLVWKRKKAGGASPQKTTE
jgi:hypothetical protein